MNVRGFAQTATAVAIFLLTSAFVLHVYAQSRDVEKFRLLRIEDAIAEMEKRIHRDGPAQAWTFLKEAYDDSTERYVGAIDPHPLAHMVGMSLYASGEPADVCDEAFSYGCFHGFTEGMLLAEGEEAIPRLNIFCTENSNNAACVHGIGHALDMYYGREIERSLTTCTEVFAQEKTHCWEGVFMNAHNLLWPEFSPDDEWAPCDSVAREYGPACATSKASHALKAGLTYAEAADVCGRAATSAMVRACIDMLGYTLANEVRGNTERIEQVCSGISVSLRDMCFRATSQLVADVAYPGWLESAAALCAHVDGSLRNDCETNLEEQIARRASE